MLRSAAVASRRTPTHETQVRVHRPLRLARLVDVGPSFTHRRIGAATRFESHPRTSSDDEMNAICRMMSSRFSASQVSHLASGIHRLNLETARLKATTPRRLNLLSHRRTLPESVRQRRASRRVVPASRSRRESLPRALAKVRSTAATGDRRRCLTAIFHAKLHRILQRSDLLFRVTRG